MTKLHDDVPDEITVKGVKGKRVNGARYYIGKLGKDRTNSGWALDVTYRFDLEELHEAGGAKYYRSSGESTNEG